MKNIRFITMGFLLSLCSIFIFISCLGEGKSYYAGSSEFSYIDLDEKNNLLYARTEGLNSITFPDIKNLKPGDCAFISYFFDHKDEKKMLDNGLAVQYSKLHADVQKIEQSKATFQMAPIANDTLFFDRVGIHLYVSTTYFGDNYLLRYKVSEEAYDKNMKSILKFYISKSDNVRDAKKIPVSDFTVDIRLEKDEENGLLRNPEGLIAVNLSDIRDSSPELKEKKIIFRYFKTGTKTPIYIDQVYRMELNN